MAIKRIDSIFDVPAIKKEKEDVSKALVDVYGNIVNLFDAIQKSKGSSTFAEVSKDAKVLDTVMKETTKSTSELEKANQKLIIAQSEYGRKLAEEKILLQQANKENANRAKLQLTEVGSISRLEAVVVKLRASQRALNLETEEGKKKNELYIKSIDFLNEKIKASSDSATKQRLNVGNYQGSAKIIVDALEKEKQKLEELQKARVNVQNAGGSFTPGAAAAQRTTVTGFAGGGATGGIQKNAAAANLSLEELDKQIAQSRTIVEGFARVTENPKFLNIAGKVGDSTAELKFFTKALIDLERQGQGNSESAIALRKHLAELTDQVGDAKAEIKALSSDTRGFDLFAGSVSFAADAFQTFAGAAVLAGASEEDAAEATKTLVAVQSVANGVKGIANELTTRGTSANKLYAYSQQIYATATDQSAAATVRLAAAGKLLLGIGLIALLGYVISNFGAIKEVLTGVTKEQLAYNETIKDYQSGASDAIKSTQKVKSAFDEAKAGVIGKDEALKIYNDTLGDAFGKTNSLAEAEKLYNDKAADYITAMGLRAQANALFAKSADIIAKGLTAEQEDQTGFLENASAVFDRLVNNNANSINTLVTAQKKGVEEAKASAAELGDALFKAGEEKAAEADVLAKKSKINLDGPDKDAEAKKKKALADAKKAAEERLKNELDLEKRNYAAIKSLLIDQANEKIRIAQGVIDNENSSLKDQLAAIEEISQQKKNIVALELADEVKADKEVKDGKIITLQKTQAEIEAATVAAANKINAINAESLKAQQDAQAKNTEKIKAEIEKQNQEKLKVLDAAAQKERDKDAKDNNDALIVLNERFAAGKMSLEEYNKEKERIEVNYQVKALQREIDFQKKLIALSTLSDDQKAEAARKLSDLEKQLSDATLKKSIENKKTEADRSKELAEIKKQLATEVYNLADTLVTAGFEKELAILDEKKKVEDASYAKEVENINNSTLTQRQKEEELAKLAKEKETRDIAYDRKQKDIKIRQAKFEKAKAIAEIGFNTAVAIVKIFKDYTFLFGLPLAAAMGALGAIQIASIAARPIPQYAQGLEDNKVAHFGIYGEAGDELIEKPGHQPFIASKATLDFLPVGTNITPLAGNDLNEIMHNSMLHSMANSMMWLKADKKKDNQLLDAVNRQTRMIIGALNKNQRPVKVTNKIDLGWADYLNKQIYH